MMSLLWKDWRLVRPLLIAAVVIYLCPFVIGLVAAGFTDAELPKNPGEWYNVLAQLCTFGVAASILAVPMFGAVMFARERRDRTTELTATLPVSRGRIVLSKAIVAVTTPLVLPAFTLVAVSVLVWLAGPAAKQDWSGDAREMMDFVLVPLGIAAMSFGLAWLFSSFLPSETTAAFLSFLLTTTVPITIALVLYRTQMIAQLGARPYYMISLPIGVVAFIAGTIIALRRVSP